MVEKCYLHMVCTPVIILTLYCHHLYYAYFLIFIIHNTYYAILHIPYFILYRIHVIYIYNAILYAVTYIIILYIHILCYNTFPLNFPLFILYIIYTIYIYNISTIYTTYYRIQCYSSIVSFILYIYIYIPSGFSSYFRLNFPLFILYIGMCLAAVSTLICSINIYNIYILLITSTLFNCFSGKSISP